MGYFEVLLARREELRPKESFTENSYAKFGEELYHIGTFLSRHAAQDATTKIRDKTMILEVV